MQMFKRNTIVLAATLIILGIVGRLVMQAYPNVEILTAVSIIAGALLGPYLGLAVALFAVIGSDMFIGNTNILLYTWSAWAVIGLSSAVLKYRGREVKHVWLDTLKFTGFGIVTTLFFYAWTNFGVWHLSGMYPHTMNGLLQSYINALPFLRNQLLGNLLIVPIVSVVLLSVVKYVTVPVRLWISSRKTA